MATVISGKELAQKLKLEMKDEIIKFNNTYKRPPKLVVILVGNDPGSESYVKGKEKASLEIGIINETIRLKEDINENELLDVIEALNSDITVDGILVQLPLPKHINKERVLESIRKDKDVDGFHSYNVARLWQKKKCIIPCTPKGIIKLIESENIEIEGKNVVVMGRSEIVGLPVAKLLIDRNATVTVVHSKTKNIKEITSKADILVVAIGKAKYVDASFIKNGATVIDVGVNRDLETGKLCGDCNFDSCKEVADFITKVPGGVGPMTICCLMENTIEAYLNHMEVQNDR